MFDLKKWDISSLFFILLTNSVVLVPHHESVWGNGGKALHILNVNTRWRLAIFG
jgi:hypothetical protein